MAVAGQFYVYSLYCDVSGEETSVAPVSVLITGHLMKNYETLVRSWRLAESTPLPDYERTMTVEVPEVKWQMSPDALQQVFCLAF